jgi:NADPH2:quinone reductase
MKAIVLKKYGASQQAFEIKDLPAPAVSDGQVLINTTFTGLNFADVMARKGLYNEAPPLPCVLGYDVAGTVAATGKGVTNLVVGDSVIAVTRFGGYAKQVVTDARAAVKIPAEWNAANAIALTTQYCTAFYAAGEAMNLHKGDKVLIQSGAGGVGIALIQYCLFKGCEIFATAGSDEKVVYLKKLGVHHPINYSRQDFFEIVKQATGGNGVDAVFDAVGGASVRKGIKLLAAGGKLVCYGASVLSSKKGLGKLKAALSFGFYHPAVLMMPSKSIIGVNMLKIADAKPALLQYCLQQVVELAKQGIFTPKDSLIFDVEDVAKAHDMLANRQTIGKVVLKW